jgi:hypothetical protein
MEKLKEEFKKHSFWWWILIIIIIIFLYNILSDNTEEYTYCVKDCSYDNSNCIADNEIIGNQDIYILGDEAEGCVDDLEYCLNNCESDYG